MTSSSRQIPEVSSVAVQLLSLLHDATGITENDWCSSFDNVVVIDYLSVCLGDTHHNDSNAIEEIVDTLIAYVPPVELISRPKLLTTVRDVIRDRDANSSLDTACATVTSAPAVDLTVDLSDVPVQTVAKSKKLKTSTDIETPDVELSKIILDKHFMVEDSKVHVPSASLLDRLTERKGKARYREGQVVSTKGGRFLEEKKDDSEEMKKTYINLKPLRKYRFH